MITFDFSNIMADSIGKNGLTEKDFFSVDTKKIIEEIKSRRFKELEFLDLPEMDISDIKKAGKYACNFDNFLLLGIGGSALGPRSIIEALSPFHNYKKKPKVFIYDNIDPLTIESILEIIDLEKSIINVITKSGSTAETIASFMILWKKLEEKS